MSLFDKLPGNLPFVSKQNRAEYFFALNIAPDHCEGAVWGLDGNHLVLINSVKTPLESDDISLAANFALDEALGDFQPEPIKILFGVPDSWLQDDTLKEEYSKKINQLTKDLDVEPLAYVSVSHALSHLLQKQQGVPITAILVGLSDPLNISVIKAGKIISSKTVARSGSLPEDIEKGLLSVTDVEVLPSKILIYPQSVKKENIEKLKDELHSFSWMQNLPFLHLPKIEILNDEIAIYSTCFAGASEMNPNAAFNEKSLRDFESKEQKISTPAHKAEDLEEEIGDKTKDEEKERKSLKSEGEDFHKAGFVAGDIENVQKIEKDEEKQLEEFDIEDKLPVRTTYNLPAKILAPVAAIFHKKPGVSGQRVSPLFRVRFIIPIIVFLVVVLGYIFLPKAEVTVFIDPKILENQSQVTVDPALTAVEEEGKKIPGKVITTAASGTQKGQATGKKLIGDAAKGSVNIYNLTSNKVSLSQGTVLTASNGLKFTLDQPVQIASQSATVGADFTTVTTPGKSQSNITASNIGPESNLPAGGNLTVAGYSQSQVIAKVDQALSGGTSKQVTVVTSDDQKRLLAEASTALRQKARDELQSKLEGDLKIVEEGLLETDTKATYSKKVNDQASEFNINLTMNFKGTAYKDSDLKTMVSRLVETNVPEGYTLNLADAQTQADIIKIEKDGKLIFQAKFRAKLMPKLDETKIKNQITGKTPSLAAQVLRGIENVYSSEIKINPVLPGPLQRLPFLPQNINIKVAAK